MYLNNEYDCCSGRWVGVLTCVVRGLYCAGGLPVMLCPYDAAAPDVRQIGGLPVVLAMMLLPHLARGRLGACRLCSP
jgi:hypothetical protein